MTFRILSHDPVRNARKRYLKADTRTKQDMVTGLSDAGFSQREIADLLAVTLYEVRKNGLWYMPPRRAAVFAAA